MCVCVEKGEWECVYTLVDVVDGHVHVFMHMRVRMCMCVCMITCKRVHE